MRFIKISSDILLNPDFISSVENRLVDGMSVLVIRCDGKDFTTIMSKDELLREMVETQTMTPEPQHFQFWAG